MTTFNIFVVVDRITKSNIAFSIGGEWMSPLTNKMVQLIPKSSFLELYCDVNFIKDKNNFLHSPFLNIKEENYVELENLVKYSIKHSPDGYYEFNNKSPKFRHDVWTIKLEGIFYDNCYDKIQNELRTICYGYLNMLSTQIKNYMDNKKFADYEKAHGIETSPTFDEYLINCIKGLVQFKFFYNDEYSLRQNNHHEKLYQIFKEEYKTVEKIIQEQTTKKVILKEISDSGFKRVPRCEAKFFELTIGKIIKKFFVINNRYIITFD
jgi:hypothetical protein